MCVVAGGVMLAGVLVGSFVDLGLALGICGVGAALLIAASWQAEKREQEVESWRAAYPSYKY